VVKRLFTILLLFYCLTSNAAIHYVATGGGGAGTLASPFANITQVNAHSFVAGDQILFNRGDTFYGTLTVGASGSAGNVIFYGAYGTGADPIITGFTTVTEWTNEGSNIFSKVITSAAQTNMVTVNGVNTGMGRTPDASFGYAAYETWNLAPALPKRITDNQLSSSPNWTGAEVVIRKNTCTIDRCLVTNHSGTVINYDELPGVGDLYPNIPGGYFFQNDIRCVTTTNEWFHNASTGKFSIYGDPSAKTVKVATLNYLIYDNGHSYITIDNIDFQGSIKSGVYFNGHSNYITVQNCNVNLSGSDGIWIGTYMSYFIVDNNTVTNSARAGIFVYGWMADHGTITNNTINYSGQIPGEANQANTATGINVEQCDYTLIQYNNVDNSGYNGIFARNYSKGGLPIAIRNNYINHSGIALNVPDGGGIYVAGDAYINGIIDGNIVINSLGVGIYLDEEATNVTVTNNTCATCSWAGFHFHKALYTTFTGNTAFNNLMFNVSYQNSKSIGFMHNNIVTNNIFFAKGMPEKTAYYLTANNLTDTKTMTNPNYNYYAKPINQTGQHIQAIGNSGRGDYNLAQWKTWCMQDANSDPSPVSVADTALIDFYINPTKTDRVIALGTPMIDVRGTKYASSITLAPYSSAILMPDPDPGTDIPVESVTVTGAGGASTITTDGGTLQLTATVLPANATNKVVIWSWFNTTGICDVSNAGLVTAITNGTVTVRASSTDGTWKSGDLVITISNQLPPVYQKILLKNESNLINNSSKAIIK